jgi:hypothetical protein
MTEFLFKANGKAAAGLLHRVNAAVFILLRLG